MAYVDHRRCPILDRVGQAAVLLFLAMSPAAAEEQYVQKPAANPSGGQPPNGQYSQPQYQQPQYQEYKPPAQYPQAPPQYPYKQYPAAKFPPGQYRGSEQDQQACIGDVFRLCNQAIPDVSRIIACLQSKRRDLSPPCKAVFGRGTRGKGTRKSQGGRQQ